MNDDKVQGKDSADDIVMDLDFEDTDDTVFLIHPSTITTKPPSASSPEIQDEAWMGGSEPDPESDDDMLEVAHTMGQQLEEDEEHPKPINLARDIDKAEEFTRTQ